jgi:Zn finger protein HypA/HybF involved in hydrogenase expression
MNSARAFMRREDYATPQTPEESSFRRFRVSCLKCGSYKLRVIGEHDHEAGELKVFLFCPQCREREQMPMR